MVFYSWCHHFGLIFFSKEWKETGDSRIINLAFAIRFLGHEIYDWIASPQVNIYLFIPQAPIKKEGNKWRAPGGDEKRIDRQQEKDEEDYERN